MTPTIDLSAGGVRWEVQSGPQGLSLEDVEHLFGNEGLRLGDWLASGAARVVKNGPHRTVYRVVLPAADFHVKHYRPAGGRGWLRRALGTTAPPAAS